MITGGASGMGHAISALFAREGAKVAVADIDLSSATSVADEIRAAGGNAGPFRLDVADEQDVIQVVQKIVHEFQSIDILVNCAAVTEFLPCEQITARMWKRMIDVDLGGVFYCCREAGKVMVEKRYGRIINFGSTAGLAGVPYMVHYTAAKHGVVGLTKALAAEWGKYNINVNCICPGATLTPMLVQSTSEEYRSERARRTPLNRLATPGDQAAVALFLAGPAAGYLTGNVICTDGGIYAMAASTSTGALEGEAFQKRK